MGSKGGSSSQAAPPPPPPPPPPAPDYGAILGPMMQSMNAAYQQQFMQMQELLGSQQQQFAQQLESVKQARDTKPKRTPSDWAKLRQDLRDSLGEKPKPPKGRRSTILTSPLAEGEDASKLDLLNNESKSNSQ